MHGHNDRVTATRRPWALISVLLVTGAAGLLASFSLTIEKLHVLADPDAQLGCDFSLIVQCGANLNSWQGSAFGFPNPLIGLMGFVAPIAVAVGLMAGARFASWFWVLFNLGVAGALGFCIWLMGQSIFVLGTLCPWCMLTWAATIIMFWTLTGYTFREGHFGSALRGFGRWMYGWVPFLVIASFLVIAIIAQVRLDVLGHLF